MSKKSREIVLLTTALAVLALVLAWFSPPFGQLSGWLSFLAVFAICALLMAGVWRIIGQESPPNWLLYLLLGAFLLRLALGVVWYLALPEFGYDTPVQQAGYIMEDAFNRDRAAWDLSQSALPLSEAFRGYSASDQYGGLLFMSAGLYRSLGTATHQPLLMLSLAAAVSALSVLFTWVFAQRIWGARVSQIAAWGLAFYPEALLLGSSQMREAFNVTFVMAALYGLLRIRQERSPMNWALLLAPLALSASLSPPFAASVLGLLTLTYLALDDWKLLRDHRVRLLFFVLLGLGLLALWRANASGDLWIVQSAEWQAYVSANASGWLARQFERMPLWGQLPFLLIYGIFRPLLPAALIADAPQIWRAVAIWRALGWTVLLGLLVYASYLVLRKREVFKTTGALLLSNWAIVLIASYRGGGDQWDNPRYRSAFAGVQLVLAAWAWVQYGESKDPWLKRAFGGAILMMAWFIPWYLRRYTAFDWPIVELHRVVGLGLVSAALYVIWDWLEA